MSLTPRVRFKAGLTYARAMSTWHCDYDFDPENPANSDCYQVRVTPSIDYIDKRHTNRRGQTVILIQGNSFGNMRRHTAQVTIGGVDCEVRRHWGRRIICKLAADPVFSTELETA